MESIGVGRGTHASTGRGAWGGGGVEGGKGCALVRVGPRWCALVRVQMKEPNRMSSVNWTVSTTESEAGMASDPPVPVISITASAQHDA